MFVGDFGFVAGDTIVLSAGGSFINSAGSGALTLFDPSVSRWLVYLTTSTGHTFGGLDSGNAPIWNTSYPTPVAASGNRYVFASAEPSLPQTPSSNNNPSQVGPPGNNPSNPGVNITFQNPTGGPINVSFTPARVASGNTDIAPASLPDGAALATNNGLSFSPISQFDPNQYSQFVLPGYADQAGLSAIFTMIARGADGQRAADYLIDTFWNGTAANWSAANPAFAGKVTFSDGAGNAVDPNGHGGFPIVPGSTDIGQLLKTGPVMISNGGQPAHWLLATQMTADGKGIVANDPATGKHVVLSYDAGTKAVGGVTGVFDAKTKGFVALADASGDLPAGSGGPVALQGFVPSTFIAVAIK